MGIVKALLKISWEKANNYIYNKELKNAQPKAYKSTCKRTRNNYDPFWHSKYNDQLAQNKQKAKENKELRSNFFDNLFK